MLIPSLKKRVFLEDADKFIDWMVHQLGHQQNSNAELHRWKSSGNWRVGVKKGEEWVCKSLWDAYKKYHWGAHVPGTCQKISEIKATERLLSQLKNDLDAAMASDAENTSVLLDACNAILEWGGVKGYRNIATVLRNDLRDDVSRRLYLRGCANRLETISKTNYADASPIEVNGASYAFQIDSGTTKIFSLLSDDFIMYDSRVGAALGFLVRKWACKQNVPKSLRFAWQGSMNRNPNIGPDCRKWEIVFPKLDQVESRLCHNVAAGWLCTEILKRGEDRWKGKGFFALGRDQRLRALEAALFMIGYRVNDCERQAKKAPKQLTKDAVKHVLDGWLGSRTLAKNKYFQWALKHDELILLTGSTGSSGCSLNKRLINNLLEFVTVDDYVVLGNSKTDKPKNIMLDRSIGWGFLKKNKVSQIYASHIAAILCDAGILQAVKEGRETHFSLADTSKSFKSLVEYYAEAIDSPR